MALNPACLIACSTVAALSLIPSVSCEASSGTLTAFSPVAPVVTANLGEARGSLLQWKEKGGFREGRS